MARGNETGPARNENNDNKTKTIIQCKDRHCFGKYQGFVILSHRNGVILAS